MSTSTTIIDEGPPAKKARVEELRPKPKFEIGDRAVILIPNGHGDDNAERSFGRLGEL